MIATVRCDYNRTIAVCPKKGDTFLHKLLTSRPVCPIAHIRNERLSWCGINFVPVTKVLKVFLLPIFELKDYHGANPCRWRKLWREYGMK
jgi:hypothetical protein